jgi:predicted enzyme related to lactoylglutathione lyase
MSNAVFGISVDCDDAAELARFWADVLDRKVQDGASADNAVLLASDDPMRGPRIAFHQVPEPKLVKNRLHLDLVTETFDAEARRLVDLGAKKVRDVLRSDARWTTFEDIEGNEFDLIAA